MNIVKDLIARIEKRLTETKNPCKLYALECDAEKKAKEFAINLAAYHSRTDADKVRPARYVVVFIPSVCKYAIGFDLTEIMGRADNAGGYLGYAATKGFYTF